MVLNLNSPKYWYHSVKKSEFWSSTSLNNNLSFYMYLLYNVYSLQVLYQPHTCSCRFSLQTHTKFQLNKWYFKKIRTHIKLLISFWAISKGPDLKMLSTTIWTFWYFKIFLRKYAWTDSCNHLRILSIHKETLYQSTKGKLNVYQIMVY